MRKSGSDNVINFLLYILGMAFNLALMALIGYLVFFAFDRAFEFGGEFADYMVSTGDDMEREFVIPEDATAAEIAVMLQEYGLIQNRWLYMVELFLRGSVREYYAGTFMLNHNMTNAQIHAALRARPDEVAESYQIRIPEGWTLRDMANYFESRGFFTAEEFLYAADNSHFNFSFLLDVPNRANRLEGYLFPDTYQIPINPTPEAIIFRMLLNFDNRFAEIYRTRADEMGLTMDEVVIMASIIERETRLADERPIVSQVIHSRLAANHLLQMCSTVKYVMDEPPIRLLYVHLEIDSPWNTYQNSGLPLGPIANPGIASIRAALWPSDTDYFFFVLRDEATGAHHFSHTLAEHDAARGRYIN